MKVMLLSWPLAILLVSGCGASTETDDRTTSGETENPVAKASLDSNSAPSGSTQKTLPPAALAAWERYSKGECSAIGATFNAVRFVPLPASSEDGSSSEELGLFVAAEFNGDGKPDFVIITEDNGCSSEASYGRSGPPLDFIMSSGEGYKANYGFNGYIFPTDIKRRAGRDVIEYNGGGRFGTCGAIQTAIWKWNGTWMEVLEWRDDAGKPVDMEGCPIGGQGAKGTVAFPPVPKGFYADGTTCARAANAPDAADGPVELTYFDETGLRWYDGGPVISGFDALGNDRFRARARSYGNGDDEIGTEANFVMRITGKATFVIERDSFFFDKPVTFTHCPTSTVPKAVQEWFGL